MSGSGPKSKDTDKIRFFKIDQEGDIAPAFPKDDKSGEAKPPSESTFARIEPVFGNDLGPTDDPPPLGADAIQLPDFSSQFIPEAQDKSQANDPGTQTGVGPVAADPQLEVQLDMLKPQIDSISRLPQKEELSNDQVDILRKYISLKEAEVRDLRDQQRQYQGFLKKISSQLETLTRKNRELLGTNESLKRDAEGAKGELREMKEKVQGDLAMMKNDYEERLRRNGNYDAAAEEFYKKREEWKEKVREELKRIKLKERELENKYELLKRDMQALLDSKDRHVLELKKKNDALELEQESLEDRLRRANIIIAAIDSKKRRLVETMKLAISLLEAIDAVDGITDEDDKRRAG